MKNSNKDSKLSMSSTFNWEDSHLPTLLKNIPFTTTKSNDIQQPFCHYSHKNLGTKMAPFASQQFRLYLDDLINVKYLCIENYTHGSQMTISIANHPNGNFTEVYQDHYVCKGKTLKDQRKMVDLGALPCRAIQIKVQKGCKISSKNISITGVESSQIEQKLGEEYFKLLVVNPMKIMYNN